MVKVSTTDIKHKIIHRVVKEYILNTKENIGYLATIKKLDLDYQSLDCSVELFLRSINMQKQDAWESAIEYVIEDSRWW